MQNNACNASEEGDFNKIHVANCHPVFYMQKFHQTLPKQKKEASYMMIELQQTIPIPKHNVSKVFISDNCDFINSAQILCTLFQTHRIFLTFLHRLRMLYDIR